MGPLLVLAGLFAFASPYFFTLTVSMMRVWAVGTLSCLLGVVILTSYPGMLIDFTQARYKEYYTVCGIKFGQWVGLPKINSVRVVSATYTSTNTANGISPTLSGKVTEYRLQLLSAEGTPALSLPYASRKKATRQAQRMAQRWAITLAE